MGILDSKESILERINLVSGKSKAELEKLIQEKKKKFSGLLTDSGAAFMIAKDLKVDLDLEKNLSEKVTIGQLADGMNHVDLDVVVKTVFAPKKFDKNNKTGTYQNISVEDASGEIKLTLWNKDSEKFESQKLEKGSKISLKNCYVNSFSEKLKLNLGNSGQFSVLEKAFPIVKKISEISPTENSDDILGRITKVFGVREFQTDKGSGKLFSFEIADESGKIRCVAWQDLLESVQGMKINDLVKIENAMPKKGYNAGTELNLGFMARVIVNPQRETKIPEALELNKAEIEEKKISDLHEGDYLKQLRGTIISLNSGRLFFNVCGKCGKKAEPKGMNFVCQNCGEIPEVGKKLLAGFDLDDGKGVIRCVCFGQQAEELFGQTTQELVEESMQKTQETVLDSLKDNIVGRQISLVGNARKNNFSESMEFIVNKINSIEGMKESPQTREEQIEEENEIHVEKHTI
ncbi:MAG: OB-fold nucleic acid binding domain-containing protein [Candidatus Diapherotrites archaeon]|nr:OB-fold nucleic acid binding domain-containing protein [Candidatus Diapherotrites archaeon]